MKKVLYVLLVAVIFAGGCITITPSSSDTADNQMPIAYIDSISPENASPGETVSFSGHGTDPDGDVLTFLL